MLRFMMSYVMGMAVICFAVSVEPHSCLSADWPMRGRSQSRNAVVPDEVGPVDWQLPTKDKPGRNILWSADLGNLSQGDPVISGGLVWVGTNNDRPRDPSKKMDAGVLMCFDEKDGKFLYQYLSERDPEGMSVDWPGSSQTASPLIEGDRLWFCNTRCEVICLDIAPLLARTGVPTVVWKVDMRDKFGVTPQSVMIGSNTAQCSIASYQNLIYVNTTTGRGYSVKHPPVSPSLICLDKSTGEVKWKDSSPGENLIDAQHGSPLVAEIDGQAQVIMGQGDGWMRGFDALTGHVLWTFDINFKATKPSHRRQIPEKNFIVGMPVLHQGRVYFATGKHLEISGGQGRLCCINPSKRGDSSSELGDHTAPALPNPKSGLIWEYIGQGTEYEGRMNCTFTSVAIHDGLAIATDTMGIVHCVDAMSGAELWTHDIEESCYSSPVIVGQRIYVCQQSDVFVFELSRDKVLLARNGAGSSSFESSPAYANGTLYLMSKRALYAIRE